jgi:hypothetical protein
MRTVGGEVQVLKLNILIAEELRIAKTAIASKFLTCRLFSHIKGETGAHSQR